MKSIEIYTTSNCPYCVSAKRFLNDRNLQFTETNVEHNYNLRDQLVEKYKWKTVPIIVIDGQCIGGFTDLVALERSGDLEKILQD